MNVKIENYDRDARKPTSFMSGMNCTYKFLNKKRFFIKLFPIFALC
jgi:hypothetical protein